VKKLQKSESNSSAFLSFVAGIIILIGGVVASFWHMTFLSQMSWMMGPQIAGGFVVGSILGIVFGGIIISAAILMNKKPLQTRQWGVIVLVFSALSFVGMGGFLIGGILGIIAGILAITKQ